MATRGARVDATAARRGGRRHAILRPTPGTPWSCAATDGDAVYDADAGTWRYLFQCLGDAPGWHGCYAERRAASPLGAFEPPAPA